MAYNPPSPPPDDPTLVRDPERSRRRCSFCGRENRDHLIGGGTTSLGICLDCVVLCVEIFEEEGSWPKG
jgi:hypothetical protein